MNNGRCLTLHVFLATMTTEQIVAELGWTRKAIKEVLGVTPNTMRPPYGDIDDRVRAISHAMGLTPVIWTSNKFDTKGLSCMLLGENNNADVLCF